MTDKAKNLEERIEEIEEMASSKADSTFKHQERTQAQVNAHFRGLARGKTILAKEAISIIHELQATNNSLEAALAASDSYYEPFKKLEEENKELKEESKDHATSLTIAYLSGSGSRDRKVWKLEEENKQLKERLKNLHNEHQEVVKIVFDICTAVQIGDLDLIGDFLKVLAQKLVDMEINLSSQLKNDVA